MKKTFHFFLSILMISSLAFLIACEEEEAPPLDSKTAAFSVVDYGLWYYWSFETEDLVGTGDADPTADDDAVWAARDDWDLAFHRQDVRTNGGSSGQGQGGAQEASSSVLAEVTVAPTSGYTVDSSVDILAEFKMPPAYVSSPANTVVSKWADFDHTEGWSVVDKVFIVKTADGKYAKIKLVNFLDADDASGFVTMEYVYQPNGSTKLE
jgi:hypothetical protein